MSTPREWKYLAPNPRSLYKQLFVKGTRIRARSLYGWLAHNKADKAEGGRTPEELAADFNLPLEAVLEAIAYVESNPPELASDYAAEEALAKATGMDTPYGPRKTPSLEELSRLNKL
jgi:uncharacterized protein (DUF433 family)